MGRRGARGRGGGGRAAGARRRARRPGGAALAHPARVAALGSRARLDRRRQRADLPDQLGGRVRLRARERGCDRRGLREPGAVREDRPAARRARGARARRRVRRGSRQRRHARRAARARTRGARARRGRGARSVGPGRGRRSADDHLHLGHDRPPEGLRAHAPPLPDDDRRGRGRSRALRGRRPGTPLPAARAQLRAARRLPRSRRGVHARVLPGGGRRAEGAPRRPPHHPPDRAAPAREGIRGDPVIRRGDGGCEGATRSLGARNGPAGQPGPAAGLAAPADAGSEAGGRRPARAAEGSRPLRRRVAARGLRGSAACRRGGRALPRGRDPRARGVRPDRVHDRLAHEPPGALPVRHGRAAARRDRGSARGRRRGAAPRRDRVRRLLAGREGDPGGRDRGRLAPDRRRRLARRGRVPDDRRSQERHHHHRRRQERLAAEHRERAEGRAARVAGARDRRPAAVPCSAAHDRPGRGRAGRRHGRRGTRRRRAGRRGGQPPPRQGRAGEALRDPRPRLPARARGS